MSVDPASVPLLVSMGKTAYNWIEQLYNTKIIINKGLTFYHRDGELEFNFLISLSGARTKLSRIVQKIQSTVGDLFVFENVVSITGLGMECGENLVALGVISFSENAAKINFNKLYDIKSNTVIIQVRTRAGDDLKRLLVSHRIEQIPQHTGKQIEAHIEVALDYANMWHNIFDQYVVRDIDFIFTLNVDLETILDQIPRKQAKRIIKAAELAVSGNAHAIRFLRIMTKSFLQFESDEVMLRLQDSISVEPKNFILKEVYPAMQHTEIPNAGYPVVLPGRMRVRIGCMLDGNQITTRGKLIIDIEMFSKILRELVQDIQKKTLKIRL